MLVAVWRAGDCVLPCLTSGWCWSAVAVKGRVHVGAAAGQSSCSDPPCSWTERNAVERAGHCVLQSLLASWQLYAAAWEGMCCSLPCSDPCRLHELSMLRAGCGLLCVLSWAVLAAVWRAGHCVLACMMSRLCSHWRAGCWRRLY